MKVQKSLIVGALALQACNAAERVGPETAGLQLSNSSVGGFVTTGGAEITLIVDNFTERWSFNAQRTLDGGFTGQFQFSARVSGNNVSAHGDILCYMIEDNRARLGGVVRQSDTFEPGTEVVWNVEDNGEGSSSSPDQASPLRLGLAVPVLQFCLSTGTFVDMLPIETGNVQIHE